MCEWHVTVTLGWHNSTYFFQCHHGARSDILAKLGGHSKNCKDIRTRDNALKNAVQTSLYIQMYIDVKESGETLDLLKIYNYNRKSVISPTNNTTQVSNFYHTGKYSSKT